MSMKEEHAIIESVLFASGYPVKFSTLAQILETDSRHISEYISELSEHYEDRGIELVVLEDQCQLCTKSKYEDKVRAALGIRKGTKLTPPLLEVLSIVAYRQPVTRAYIEQVRGVDCAYSITALCDKGMIEAKGNLDLPGRPVIYGTTPDFLRAFGITSINDLPPIEMFDAVTYGSNEITDDEETN